MKFLSLLGLIGFLSLPNTAKTEGYSSINPGYYWSQTERGFSGEGEIGFTGHLLNPRFNVEFENSLALKAGFSLGNKRIAPYFTIGPSIVFEPSLHGTSTSLEKTLGIESRITDNLRIGAEYQTKNHPSDMEINNPISLENINKNNKVFKLVIKYNQNS